MSYAAFLLGKSVVLKVFEATDEYHLYKNYFVHGRLIISAESKPVCKVMPGASAAEFSAESQEILLLQRKLFAFFQVSFIHSFIADIYIAPLQVELLRSAPNPSAPE